jgi:NAD(P)-dependent dehydrogenase (short-subunit alcohol dehydrogenase family)
MQDLSGKTAVVTGAGSGIGRALAEHLGQEGMIVVAADVEEPTLTETVDAITAAGGTAVGVPTDVSDGDAVQRLADTAFGDHGGVHLLCNNAGVFSGGLVWERTVRDFDWVMGVNVFGIVHAIRSFVPRMIAQDVECHIVNTASMGGLVTNAYSGPYYASKFAAVGLTECLAHDLAAAGAKVGVSVLVPSLIATSIGTSERNRQERFVERGNPEPTPDAAFVTQMLRDSTAGGMPPAEVAALVVDAVRAGRFYIPTKPSYHEQIAQRHEDMQALRLPRSPAID